MGQKQTSTIYQCDICGGETPPTDQRPEGWIEDVRTPYIEHNAAGERVIREPYGEDEICPECAVVLSAAVHLCRARFARTEQGDAEADWLLENIEDLHRDGSAILDEEEPGTWDDGNDGSGAEPDSYPSKGAV